ncbi:hypothetical protein STSP2_00664 [Anaerohalosphaera lusitana]|uniref:Glycosyl hydrolase family 95 N-terminal domain-containing protein n=1 Tax=Anaerohalosphaera lusitana TaxID=1936003 RepID=A0A1U9NJ28_9BACT|nr:hypothetical protein [Anaerohalosphaera lusitana]AQT67516.1 hypothetical protein STSP2_00664 [Anaerohalosphaera lusitana]
MLRIRVLCVLVCVVLGFCGVCVGGVEMEVDWAEYISEQDPVWEAMPKRWYDAPFMGNGMLGTLVRQSGDKQVRWDVGRTDVQDHRMNDDYTVRAPEILNRGRVPIGHFVLDTEGDIEGGSSRIHLWDAEATGEIGTSEGSVKWRTLVHADDMVYMVVLEGEGRESSPELRFVPERAESTRYTRRKGGLKKEFVENYTPNPEPVIGERADGVTVCVQDMVAGGETATAWWSGVEDGKRVYFVTVQHTYPGKDADGLAVAELAKVRGRDREDWIGEHRGWWRDYYKQSFVSISDPVWESFYWIQMYKLACATRADRALIDNQGPWLQPTGWNGTWWNLNIQLSYSPVAQANRLGIGESLTNHLQDNFQTLVNNVAEEYRSDSAGLTRNTGNDLIGKVGEPGGWGYGPADIGSEVGNLTWTCHNVWMMYRYSMDEELRDELLYPLLRRAVNYYRHFLYEGEDGRLHLPETHSPEYGNAEDANYDLALIKWGCRTLLELADERGKTDPLEDEWRRILDELVEFPVNENGFMVGRGVGFDKSHRHWSHMLAVYPLRIVTPETEAGEELIRKSLKRWHSFKGALVGYSYTGGASFSALLGNGDKTLEYLNGFKRYMGDSTMYYEGGRRAGLPVMETPLHCSEAIQEMLLQSWGGKIRVFPAMPDAWGESMFHDMRAEGAFLVSAERDEGETEWVRVRSLAGERCVVRCDLDEPRATVGGKERELKELEPGVYEVELAEGEEVFIFAEGEDEFEVEPADDEGGDEHAWGVK